MVNPIPLHPKKSDSSRSNVASEEDELGGVVGENLKRLRNRRNLSLEALSKLSGVSRAMLSQIELGRSVPTINLVFKIARAFDIPFSTLLVSQNSPTTRILPANLSKVLKSGSGEFSSRALFPFTPDRKTEFYELRLSPGGKENADPHAPGTTENLVVAIGALNIEIGGMEHRLTTGDAIHFLADRPHAYHNPSSEESVIYLVMSYPDSIS
jgi:transcriptional regulator with XRE-family HTH domain